MPLDDFEFPVATFRNRRGFHDESEEAKTIERNNVERRRYWLAKLPKMYTPGHRQRYLFLNLDNVASALLMSNTLYQRVDGAASARDIILNFAALTRHLGGNNPAVKFQLATYCKTSPFVAHALEKSGWELKLSTNNDNTLYNELMKQLNKAATNTNGKTLVLATGDGYLGTGNPNAYREVVCKFLKQGWYVEVHAWLYALNDGYLRLQKENPGRVVVKPLDDVICTLAYTNGRRFGCTPHQGETARELSPTRFSRMKNQRTDTRAAIRSPVASTSGVMPRRGSIRPPSKPSVWSTSLANRTFGTPLIPNRVAPAAAVTRPPHSWAKVVKEGRTSWSTTSATESSSPESAFCGLAESPESPESPLLPSRWSPAAPAPPQPTTPLFPSPVSTRRESSVHSGLMWSLQMQQMQDLLSSQQADLAMRQTVLQQTTELMRAMREQDQRLRSGASYRQARGPRSP